MLNGMISSVSSYLSFIGYSGRDRDAVYAALLAEVSDAIAKLVSPNVIEPATTTEYLDAPPSEWLLLRRPTRSITSVYYDPSACYGQASGAFASTTLLTAGSDYVLVPDQPDGSSRAGRLLRLSSGFPTVWGASYRRGVGNLASELVPERGSVKVVSLIGYATVPDGVVLAAHLGVSMLFSRRKLGAPMQSENLTGYSYNLAQQFTATSVLNSPDIRTLLDPYRPVVFA